MKSLGSRTVVIGGGLVGAAVAFGLARLGEEVLLLDESDNAFRASRGNFGLVWVQGKGSHLAAYAPWAQQAARDWNRLDRELLELTGTDVELEQNGGLFLLFDEAEFRQREAMLRAISAATPSSDFAYEMLDHTGVKRLLPGIGKAVVGASYSRSDGAANPLLLLRALHQALTRLGGKIRNSAPVSGVAPAGSGFRLLSGDTVIDCERLVLAAGLGNLALADQLGTSIPIRPIRGQILVTERVPPWLPLPTETVRQNRAGTMLLGGSWEDVGLDTGTTHQVNAKIARRASETFPFLSDVNLVRAWGALRILSPDSSPIYQELPKHKGAFLITCHSGVSLAAAHAYQVAEWIKQGSIPASASPFSLARFDAIAQVD